MRKLTLAIILAAVFASSALSGCGRNSAPTNQPTPEMSAGFGTQRTVPAYPH